jgi:hypothetical protein
VAPSLGTSWCSDLDSLSSVVSVFCRWLCFL